MTNLQPSRRDLGFLFGGNVLFGAGLFFHAFLYNFYLEAIGHAEAVMGYAAASLTAGALAALLPAGKLVDARGPRLVLCTGVMLGVLGLAAGALVAAPAAVYAAAALAGAGAGSWRVAQGPMIMGLTDSDTRPRAFSWNVGFLVGTGGLWILISGSVPAWLEATLGVTPLVAIRIALLAGAVATLGGLILFVVLPRGDGGVGSGVGADTSAPTSGEDRAAAVSSLAPPPPVPATVIILVVLVAAWMLGPALVTPFFNIFFNRELGLPVAQIGLIFAVAHLITACAIFGSGELAARLGPKRALAGWMLLFGPTMLAMAVVGSVGMATVLYLVQGFVSPATNPLIDQILLELAPASRRGMVSSWRNAATEGSGAGAAAVGGVVLQSGSFATLFATAGVTGLIAAILLLFGLARAPTPAPAPAGRAVDG